VAHPGVFVAPPTAHPVWNPPSAPVAVAAKQTAMETAFVEVRNLYALVDAGAPEPRDWGRLMGTGRPHQGVIGPYW